MLLLLCSSWLASPASASSDTEYHLEGSAELLPANVALDARFRVEGKHDGYMLGAVRVDPTGAWIGRAGVGIDLLGGAEWLDVKVGLFLGGVGDVSTSQVSMIGRPAAGFEGQIGSRIGRVYGYYRHMDGFAGPLEDRLTEDELRVGFRITDDWRIHGQYVIMNPGTDTWNHASGLGVEHVF